MWRGRSEGHRHCLTSRHLPRRITWHGVLVPSVPLVARYGSQPNLDAK